MISAKRSIQNKDSLTCVKIVGINPKSIIEEMLSKDISKMVDKSRRGDTSTSDHYTRNIDISKGSNSTIFLSKSSDPGGRAFISENKIFIDHKRFYTPYLDNIQMKNLKGDPYLELIKDTKICCFCDRNEITNTTPMPIPCIITFDEDDKISIHGNGNLCSLECGLAFIDDEESKMPCKRDPMYINVRANIHIIFHYMCKYIQDLSSIELLPASDWKLLKYTGSGDMDINYYRSLLTIFIKLPIFKLYPLQSCYQISL